MTTLVIHPKAKKGLRPFLELAASIGAYLYVFIAICTLSDSNLNPLIGIAIVLIALFSYLYHVYLRKVKKVPGFLGKSKQPFGDEMMYLSCCVAFGVSTIAFLTSVMAQIFPQWATDSLILNESTSQLQNILIIAIGIMLIFLSVFVIPIIIYSLFKKAYFSDKGINTSMALIFLSIFFFSFLFAVKILEPAFPIIYENFQENPLFQDIVGFIIGAPAILYGNMLFGKRF